MKVHVKILSWMIQWTLIHEAPWMERNLQILYMHGAELNFWLTPACRVACRKLLEWLVTLGKW